MWLLKTSIRNGRGGWRALSLCLALSLQLAAALAAPPGLPSNPTPANLATSVDINTTFTWTVGSGATSHDIYLGPENPPLYQCRVTAASFNPATFGRNKTYYWRVDEVNVDGTTQGPVWQFTTEATADIADRYKWPRWVCQTLLNRYPTPTGGCAAWDYPEALFLSGMYEVWKETGGPRADLPTGYLQVWADRTVQTDGTLNFNYNPTEYNLDKTSPGRVLMAVYTETGQAKYLTGAGHIISDQLASHPRTSDRGFWHKQVYSYQMWLDGLYMAQPFTMWWAQTTSNTQWTDEATSQILLVASHTQDPVTGLLYHGWQETKARWWADPVTGCSPEFWGRAMGWYIAAIVDVLDRLPEDHYNRAAIIAVLQDFVEGLANAQDPVTGMWFQVVDKGHLTDNWVESSCTALYVYGIAKAVWKGYVDPQYLDNAWRGYRGLLNNEVWVNGANLVLEGTVRVGSLGPGCDPYYPSMYNYYVFPDIVQNDEKGVGALIYASLQMSRMTEWEPTATPTPTPTPGTETRAQYFMLYE